CATRRLVLEQRGNKAARPPMTSPRAATPTTDRTHVRRRNWAGEPTLLLGENACGYDELLAEVSRVLLPRAQARRSYCRCTALRGRMPARRPADRCPRHPRGAIAPSCACARGSRRAGFDTFRKRSQFPRTKRTSKNP